MEARVKTRETLRGFRLVRSLEDDVTIPGMTVPRSIKRYSWDSHGEQCPHYRIDNACDISSRVQCAFDAINKAS